MPAMHLHTDITIIQVAIGQVPSRLFQIEISNKNENFHLKVTLSDEQETHVSAEKLFEVAINWILNDISKYGKGEEISHVFNRKNLIHTTIPGQDRILHRHQVNVPITLI